MSGRKISKPHYGDIYYKKMIMRSYEIAAKAYEEYRWPWFHGLFPKGKASTIQFFGYMKAKEIHIGEPISLLEIARKHYYYGRTVKSFLDANPGRGLLQISPLRPAFVRNWKNFAKYPMLTIGFFVYQITRYFSAGLGFLASKVRR